MPLVILCTICLTLKFAHHMEKESLPPQMESAYDFLIGPVNHALNQQDITKEQYLSISSAIEHTLSKLEWEIKREIVNCLNEDDYIPFK